MIYKLPYTSNKLHSLETILLLKGSVIGTWINDCYLTSEVLEIDWAMLSIKLSTPSAEFKFLYDHGLISFYLGIGHNSKTNAVYPELFIQIDEHKYYQSLLGK